MQDVKPKFICFVGRFYAVLLTTQFLSSKTFLMFQRIPSLVLQVTSIPERVFISQYSLSIYFSYFGRVIPISLRYITLKQPKDFVYIQTYTFSLFKCRVLTVY